MNKINLILLRSDISQHNKLLDIEFDDFKNQLIQHGFELNESGNPLFYIGTGGTEELFKKIYLNYKSPYVLVATDHNNSLPASLEILTFLNNLGLSGVIRHGNVQDIINQLNEPINNVKIGDLGRLIKSKGLLNNKRYGVIGKPSNWLISSNVDCKLAKEKLGCDLIDIDDNEIIERAKKYHIFLSKESNVSLTSVLVLKALEEIVNEYKLDGLTIRCFDLLFKMNGTSCYALAVLNSRGIIATCEGDIPAMLSMALIKEITGQSSFQANPSFIDIKNNEISLAHCTVPLDMLSSYKITTHFESGIGDAVKGELYLKNIHLFKLSPNLDEFFYVDGKIIENLHSKCLCRTQIRVKTTQEITSLLSKPFANHIIVYYDNDENAPLINTL